MFPWVYEFRWTPFHLMFLGVFFSVIVAVIFTVGKAFARAKRDFTSRKSEKVIWKATFEDLPLRARSCRHEMTGEMRGRTCPNAFDCRLCVTHQGLLAADPQAPAAGVTSQGREELCGLDIPLDRYYHRGHTWVRPEDDGTVVVGLDPLARRLAGAIEGVDLPPVGTRVEANGTGWRFTSMGRSVRVISPVDGHVVSHGDPDQQWSIRIFPDSDDFRHLLRGGEVRPWMLREIERLEAAISPAGVGATLADGGILADDLSVLLNDDLELVRSEMFLEP